MYCVMCGVKFVESIDEQGKLTHNQCGLVCTKCQPSLVSNTNRKRLLEVLYCWVCGQSYIPSDHTVKHGTCFL